MRPLIALAIVAGFVAASVGLARIAPSANGPVTSGGRAVHRELVAPEDRFSIIPKGFWDSRTKDYDIGAADDATYRLAIEKVGDGGFESLSDDERHLVVAVAWTSFAWQAEAIRYHVQLGWNGRSYLDFHDVRDERYEVVDFEGISMPGLTALRTFVGSKSPSSSDSQQADMFADLSMPAETGDDMMLTKWARHDDTWTCIRQSGKTALSVADYYKGVISHLMLEPSLVKGNFEGREDVNGTAAYKIVAAPLAAEKPEVGGKRTVLWLDVASLLPLQYEEAEVDLGSGEETGSKGLYTVLEVNGDLEIEPPDTKVECVETSG